MSEMIEKKYDDNKWHEKFLEYDEKGNLIRIKDSEEVEY